MSLSLAERVRSGELKKRKSAVYHYANEYGRTVLKKIRYGLYDRDGQYVDKTFRIEHLPAPRSRPFAWRSGIGQYGRLMYRLTDLQTALYFGEDIYWCEGEKDADVGASLGIVTTSHYQGAGCGTVAQVQWFRSFRGWVHLVMDRDPVGFYIAQQHAALLARERVKTRFLLPATREPKSDLYDHVRAGYGPDDLGEVAPERVKEVARRIEPRMRAGYGGGSLGSAAWLEARQDWEGSAWRRRAEGR